MTTEAKYNGWTNYQTWAVKLWLDDDEWRQELQFTLLNEAVNEAWKPKAGRDEETPQVQDVSLRLADLLADYVDEHNPLADTATMYADLMRYAINNEVNWREIADHIIIAHSNWERGKWESGFLPAYSTRKSITTTS